MGEGKPHLPLQHRIILKYFGKVDFPYIPPGKCVSQCDRSQDCQHKDNDRDQRRLRHEFSCVQIAHFQHITHCDDRERKGDQDRASGKDGSLDTEHFPDIGRCQPDGHVPCEFPFPLPDESQSVGEDVADPDDGKQNTEASESNPHSL